MQMKVPIKLFSAWMGPGEMSEARAKALNSIVIHCGVPFNFISNTNIQSWIHKDFPLHPAFHLLSAVHQCDYLRCYVLHVYGGGYTDIKPTNHNWNQFFEDFRNSKYEYGAGYTEINSFGVAKVGGNLEELMKNNYEKLIGVCSLIVTPNTTFTKTWFAKTHALLDKNISKLIENPAKHPQDHLEAKFEGGHISQYPLRWTELGGDILHPLIFENYSSFMHLNMAPIFTNYR
jgi:hypothetical protein